MTIAISEIMKQVELLSATEQEELTRQLIERTRQRQASQHQNGQTPASASESLPPAQALAVEQGSEEAEEEFITDVFSLNRVPPKRTYMARARFRYVGRGKPMPYELDDDLLDAEEGSAGEAS